jgi:hypothetical protein
MSEAKIGGGTNANPEAVLLTVRKKNNYEGNPGPWPRKYTLEYACIVDS